MFKKTLLVLLPLAILAGGWYFGLHENSDSHELIPTESSPTLSNSGNDHTTSNEATAANNPLETKKDDAALIAESIESDSTDTSASQLESEQLNNANTSLSAADNIEPSSVAVEPLTDEEFIRLEEQLKTDRQLRLSLLEEFRYTIDPARAKQLAALLGPYNDPEILQVASELAYSGDLQSRIAGLDLLRRIQPRSDEARNIAIELLSSGDDTQMLVATMNVLATPPSRRANDAQLQSLNDNLNNLSNHYDATVRSQSMALLGRWDKNSMVAREALSRGLNDPDPAVRSSAAFAINNISNPDDDMIAGLLSIAENTTEIKPTRFAALRALGSMQLSATQQRRYEVAKRSANRRG